jgi:myo-inositol-1-phosphate synthase
VVNVASSEPPAEGRLQRISLQKLKRMLGKKVAPASSGAKRSTRTPGRGETGTIPASCLYALAAIETGCPFVNFTPSTGIALPAIRQRADELGVPYMGNDGKTGETLVKSALAPLFATRNLSVLSWVGQNILGNRDGAVLKNPRTQASKLRTKDGVVSRIVGGAPMTQVSIDYVPSLDDWKVAWDFIHFEGFLGTKMSMQFTWQGCDSILAAPLIIDLVRFTVLETQRGASGPMRHLAFFFKDPIDVDVHDLAGQWRMLVSHVTHESVPSRAMTRIR